MNQNDRRALLAMMSARQDVKSSGELSNALLGQLSTQMSTAIDVAVKEIVK
jgi:hypothetical protein